MHYKTKLLEKIASGEEIVGVIGLGYVGLPLAVNFAEAGVKVIGFEKNQQKAGLVNKGSNYIADIHDSTLFKVVEENKLEATTDFVRMKECDALIIAVPTPLDIFRKPDMSYIESACEAIGKYMKAGTFVSLESTTYPTTTEELMLPILENRSGLKQGKDFWLAYSPERVDPGNQDFHTRNTPKVMGAMSKDGEDIGEALYKKAIDKIYTVSSPRIAEMVKILENTYRLVNISLINELALLSGKMDINIWEVIDAAKTKPFGFQAFYPGPGIGGHCIPLDPFYLEYIAKRFDFDLTMINSAGHINMRMPHYMYIKISTALNSVKKAVKGSKVLFMGVAYKPDIDDERESPALDIMDVIAHKGGEVLYHDPYVMSVKTNDGFEYETKELGASLLKEVDCVVLTTNHQCFDADFIEKNASLVVDLRNIIKNKTEKVFKL